MNDPKKPVGDGLESQVFLSAPWAPDNQACVSLPGQSFAAAERFLIERSRAHELYIREEAKTQRLTLIIAAIIFLAGCATILFAPEKREAVFVWVGAAMLVVAAGVGGYKRVWAKSKTFELRADQNKSGK